jgi:hypothetical protein
MAQAEGLQRWLPWLVAYAAVQAAVVVATFKARDWAIEQLATPKSQADWQTWRDDVKRQQGQPGPIQRRVPKSNEPPALVLMRDHFGVSFVAAVLFSTILYWVFAWFVTGVMRPSGFPAAVKR